MRTEGVFTRIRKRPLAMVAAGALALGGLVAIPAAMAAIGGPYNIDGVLNDVSPGITDPSGNTQELGPINSNATKLGVIHTALPPMLGTTNPNGQVDLNTVYLGTQEGEGKDIWLYLGWKRDSNKGSGVLMYEFQQAALPTACAYGTATDAELIAGCNPWADRQVGDFLLVWDQQGNSTDIILRYWLDANNDGVLELETPGTNLTASGFAEATFTADKYGGEAQVNLTDSGVFEGDKCEAFANVIPGTVTGNSDTADYKDTVLTKVEPITNCGIVTIEKVTSDGGTAQSFDWTLARSGGDPIKYDDSTSASDSITHGTANIDTVDDLIAGTDYTLVEADPGPEYALTSIVCTLNSTTYKVYPEEADFSVVAGKTTACVITNTLQPGTLTVQKVLDYKWGGTADESAFSFSVNGGTAIPFESDGSNSLTVDAGTYNVTEPTIPANYKLKSNDCKDVVVPAGGSASCTITNEDVPATLIVKKVVDNAAGGTKKAEDFAFTVNGGDKVQFEADGQNNLEVAKGTYSVTEFEDLGYDVTYDNCKDVVIPYAGSATCTITNTFPQNAPVAKTVQSWVLHDSFSAEIRPGAPNAKDAEVTFTLFTDQQCTVQFGTAEVVAVTLSGDGKTASATTATGFPVTDTSKDYFWTVEYSGDDFNTSATSGCTAEVTRILAKDDYPPSGRNDFPPE